MGLGWVCDGLVWGGRGIEVWDGVGMGWDGIESMVVGMGCSRVWNGSGHKMGVDMGCWWVYNNRGYVMVLGETLVSLDDCGMGWNEIYVKWNLVRCGMVAGIRWVVNGIGINMEAGEMKKCEGQIK